MLQNEIARVQVPRALEHMKGGSPVVFGDFTLTRHGIATKRKGQVPWAAIEKIEVHQGTVRVAQAGRWLAFSSTAAANIPNLYTFFCVTEEMIAAHRASQPL